jgi:hypothetical protein
MTHLHLFPSFHRLNVLLVTDHTLLRPSRPAPKPPGAIRDTYATIAAYSGKFVLCVGRNNGYTNTEQK